MTASLPISRRILIGGGQGHGSTEDQAKKCVAFPGFALSLYLLDNHDCIDLQHNCGCRGALSQHKGPSRSRKAIPRQVDQKSTVHVHQASEIINQLIYGLKSIISRSWFPGQLIKDYFPWFLGQRYWQSLPSASYSTWPDSLSCGKSSPQSQIGRHSKEWTTRSPWGKARF